MQNWFMNFSMKIITIMKTIRKRKNIVVTYKGYRATQVPPKGLLKGCFVFIQDRFKYPIIPIPQRKCRKRKELRLELIRFVQDLKKLAENRQAGWSEEGNRDYGSKRSQRNS